MKKVLISAFALVALASCKKEGVSPDAVKPLTYDVLCQHCLVYVKDVYVTKNFVVDGSWHYSIANPDTLSVARLQVYTGAINLPKQAVKAFITQGSKKIVLNAEMGWESKTGVIDTAVTLQLR